MTIMDELESGQEYFKFEKDPHKDLKEHNSQYSETYIHNRYYVQKQLKPFLSDEYNKGKCTQ